MTVTLNALVLSILMLAALAFITVESDMVRCTEIGARDLFGNLLSVQINVNHGYLCFIKT